MAKSSHHQAMVLHQAMVPINFNRATAAEAVAIAIIVINHVFALPKKEIK